MKAGFFPKLAWDSIKKNRRVYLPFMLTCQLCVCMFYLLQALCDNPNIQHMRGGETTYIILQLGSIVIGVFSTVFLFYTFSFLIRRRKREFGLYSVLGLDKHAIDRILLCEVLITMGITVLIGLFAGVTVSKLSELLLVRLSRSKPETGFFVSGNGLKNTVILFSVIFLLLFLNGSRQVHSSAAVDLLRSERHGEKPPKANWVLALLGMVLLGVAYFIAVRIKEPLTTLLLFFVAVILVIAATYLLMISGSVTLCRLLQKNKNYYYQPKHFISIGSLVYRMKRNGAGLASICILATMVLVMITSTTCLYFGADDVIEMRYAGDFTFSLRAKNYADTETLSDEARALICRTVDQNGVEQHDVQDYRYATVNGLRLDNRLVLDVQEVQAADVNPILYEKLINVCFLDTEEYNRMHSRTLTLGEGETAVFVSRCEFPYDTLDLDVLDVKITERLPDLNMTGGLGTDAIPTLYVVVNEMNRFVQPLAELTDYRGDSMLSMAWHYSFNADLTDEEEVWLLRSFEEALQPMTGKENELVRSCTASCRSIEREDYLGTFSGFFFLGILLSLVFLAATAIIIYYKQLSEGYEDQERFAILQNIGMTKDEIRSSINWQMLIVFFFPLAMAVLHLCFAFPMIRNLLLLFGLNNLSVLLRVTALSVAAFAAFYVLVYRKTASVYYRLVIHEQ